MVTEAKLGCCKYCGDKRHRGWQCPQRPPKQKHAKMQPNGNRPQRQNRSALIRKTDMAFSQALRRRAEKCPFCFICGKRLKPSEMMCLHFYSRRFIGVRWDEDNVHVGCWKCNCPDSDQPAVLEEYERLLGEETVNRLRMEKNNKLTDSEIENIYNRYKEELRNANAESAKQENR